MNQPLKRNMLIFEAPKDLTEKAKGLAEAKMVSTSAICRQALQHYLSKYDVYYKSDNTIKL